MCDDSFSNTEATVVCRQLGYNALLAVTRPHAHYGEGSGRIWLDDVSCHGFESHLSYCTHAGWGNNDCSPREDVGVECSKYHCNVLSHLFDFTRRASVGLDLNEGIPFQRSLCRHCYAK